MIQKPVVSLYYLPHQALVLQKFSREINRLLVVGMLQDLYAQQWHPLGRHIISDLRGVKAKVLSGDLEAIASYIRLYARYDKPIVNVILVDQPMETAYTMIYRNLTRDLDYYHCEICCTLESAALTLNLEVHWLEFLLDRPNACLKQGDYASVIDETGAVVRKAISA
jgi:hypothetical protein